MYYVKCLQLEDTEITDNIKEQLIVELYSK